MAIKTEAVKAEPEETYEARKAMAFAKGRKYLYLKCPLCNLGRPFKTHLSGQSRFRIYPEPDVVQVRYGIGGRGTGFFKKEEECIKISELKRAYPEVYENLRAEVERLYNMLRG